MKAMEPSRKRLQEIETLITNKTNHIINIHDIKGEFNRLKNKVMEMRKKNITGWREALQMIADFEEIYFDED